ncbi:MAG: hypothetical protein K2K56_05585 [Lachnospiraceae bacterium]|nr:hypothetical protein [Lachnospiraceae bacterium]MDE6625821.1 hypothetical protein [Lachnospiraceae bacterium]
MRITTSMLAQTSRETGLPILQNSLLSVLNKQSSGSGDLLDALTSKQNAEKISALQKSTKELGGAADKLAAGASKLTETGEKSLFEKAKESGDTKELLLEIESMVEHYNKTLELLKKADSSLNSFYHRELKNAAEATAEQLRAVGVTQNKDGSLAVDKKALESADYDALKAAFGENSKFTTRTEFISSKVSDNADAVLNSVSNQYNAKGLSYSDSFEANKYNFFG